MGSRFAPASVLSRRVCLILTTVSDQQAAAELHRIEVGGLTIAYRQAGSGPTLVLLHGAFEDSRVWIRQMEDLSDEFTVIALDAPGFGASDDPPPTWTTADYGNHLADVLDALGLDRPTLVGQSFATITVPTLLIYGDADVRSPADVVGRDMHARIPGSTLVVIPDAPHMINLEQPEALRAAIRRFAGEY